METTTTKYSTVYRIVHWAIAISFLLLLNTIFLRLTWLNKNNMADIMQEYLKGAGQSLSQDQVIAMAKKIREPMWNWHIYIGYILVGLLSIRFALPFFGEMEFQNPLVMGISTKIKFQRWIYIILYACIVISLVTGLLIKFGPKSLREPMEEIHALGIYYIVPFIIIHLAGILIAEFTDQKGIVSRIISGSDHRV
ncbi:MAG: cytochrome b/b6 domain-containing protein [Bacteroidetes bacterium]|nr:cytochrome b/b6 domain-containing protein [Bacteroidota bacterium]